MSYYCLYCGTSTGYGCGAPGCVYRKDHADERMYRPGWEDDWPSEDETRGISDREWNAYHSAPKSDWRPPTDECPDYRDQYLPGTLDVSRVEPCGEPRLASPAPVAPVIAPRSPGVGPPALQRPPTPPTHGAEPDRPMFPDPGSCLICGACTGHGCGATPCVYRGATRTTRPPN